MKPPLHNYLGNKIKMVKEILPLFPPHNVYVEPFFGTGALFFAKDLTNTEVINDKRGEVVNFFEVLKKKPDELKKELSVYLHSRDQYRVAVLGMCDASYSPVKRAAMFFVATVQAYRGVTELSSWKHERPRNGRKSVAHNTKNRIDFFVSSIREYERRLKTTLIENADVLYVIKKYDSRNTFFYLDPPYIGTTQGVYSKYTESDYKRLLEVLKGIKGKFLLSSFDNEPLSSALKSTPWGKKEVIREFTHFGERLERKEVLVGNFEFPSAQIMSPKTVLPCTRKRNFIVYDLFCGVGGLSHGLNRAGMHIRAGWDQDKYAGYAFTENHTDAGGAPPTFHAGSIEPKKTAMRIRRYKRQGDITVICGGPPCQPFSALNAKKDVDDVRLSCFASFLSTIEQTAPDVVISENVREARTAREGVEYKRGLKKLGYGIIEKNIDFSKYGVPQTRKRWIVVAFKTGVPSFPEETHKAPGTLRDAIGDFATAVEAGLPADDKYHTYIPPLGVALARMKVSKPGGSFRDWPIRLWVKSQMEIARKGVKGFDNVYGRAGWDLPAPTITCAFTRQGSGRFTHPEEHRTFTLREGARIQTFPDGFKFHDPATPLYRTRVARHIGNAVPPLFAEILGKHIISTFKC